MIRPRVVIPTVAVSMFIGFVFGAIAGAIIMQVLR